MHVKLVSIAKPVIYQEQERIDDDMDAEGLIVYMARVSSPKNQLNMDTAPKLLAYLIRNKHWSPFDMVNMVVEVKTSKAIAIQILRHWSIKISDEVEDFRVQEFSQRYAVVEDIEPVHFRKAAASNRQSSEDRFDPLLKGLSMGADWETDVRASTLVQEYFDYGQKLYRGLLDAGVAKECARFILPMATSTTLYLNGSVRSWIHYLEQRTDPHAQLEHREVADCVKTIFNKHFPNIVKALEYGTETSDSKIASS